MKQLNYLYTLVMLLALAACTDDVDLQQQEAHVCVQYAWTDGRGLSHTKAASASVLSAAAGEAITIAAADYPAVVNVRVGNDGPQHTLTKGSSTCKDHSDYYCYTPSFNFAEVKDQTLYATATVDGETVTGTAQVDADGHLRLDLHHTKALLRFAFKVAEKYDSIRYVCITDVKLNGATCTLADKVLNKTDMQLIAYGYIDPAVVSITSNNSLKCTYNVYDKDGVSPEHLVRTDEASNTFRLGSTSITSIQAGCYYDLNVTLNPDSLKVLSDHDDKHITIN